LNQPTEIMARMISCRIPPQCDRDFSLRFFVLSSKGEEGRRQAEIPSGMAGRQALRMSSCSFSASNRPFPSLPPAPSVPPFNHCLARDPLLADATRAANATGLSSYPTRILRDRIIAGDEGIH